MANVLLVDDEPGIRSSFAKLLTRRGHAVRVAESAEDALDILASQHFDVVVTDLLLPRLSGLDLVERIRRLELDARVVVLTGRPTSDTAERAEDLKVFGYLAKPIMPRELAELVERAVGAA